MNGKYYGKFSFSEQFDEDTLQVGGQGLRAVGPCAWAEC